MSSTTSSAVSSMPNSMSSMASSISGRVSSMSNTLSSIVSSTVSSILLLPWNLKLVRLGGDTQGVTPNLRGEGSHLHPRNSYEIFKVLAFLSHRSLCIGLRTNRTYRFHKWLIPLSNHFHKPMSRVLTPTCFFKSLYGLALLILL